jgi:hypothetical protein
MNPKPSIGKVFMYVLTGLLIILLALGYLDTNCNGNGKNGTPVDSVYYWQNYANELTASLRGSRQDFATMEKHYLDSIAKVYATKTKYIKQVVVIESKGETVLAPVDSTLRKEFEPITKPDCPPQINSLSQKFTNPYYMADVRIGAGSYLKLQSFDTLTILTKRVKSGGFFSRRSHLQIDASTANPFIVLAGIKSYIVREPKPAKIGVGLQVGYGFSNGIIPKVYAGIGISYNLFYIR